VRRDPLYESNSYAYKFDRRLVDNLLPRKPWSESNDPHWDDMWYLNRRDDHNMMVEGAWNLGMSRGCRHHP